LYHVTPFNANTNEFGASRTGELAAHQILLGAAGCRGGNRVPNQRRGLS
jgi:hypothetical protein